MVGSGTLSTELIKMGYQTSENVAAWEVEHPEALKDVLKSWVDAGANLLCLSGAGNRFRLSHVGLGDQASRINRELARLGREACPPDCYLCASLASTGHLLQPLGDISLEQAYESYKEQVLAAAEGGVDLIWVWTMTEIPAAEAAIRAVKDNTSLPVIASMVFDQTPKGFRTMMGQSPKEVADKLEKAGADVIGVNCGSVTPAQITDILREMAEVTTKPLAAKPNAGTPQVSGSEIAYSVSPEEMAGQVPMWIAAGARVVSGCCGSTPEHITKMAEAV